MLKAKRIKFYLILLLGVLWPSLALAQTQQNSVTVDVDNATLAELFQKIEYQTPYRFSYRNNVVPNAHDVTVHLKNATVEQVLEAALKGHDLSYKIVSDKSIVITKKTTDRKSAASQPGKKITVHGQVVDLQGEPIVGASVRQEGSKIGMATDVDGNFSLTVDNSEPLTISFIGYKPQTLKPRADKKLKVVMVEDSKMLDEVVAIGYGSTTRRDLIASMGTYKPDADNTHRVTNAAQLLQGRVAGLNVSGTSGTLGARSRVSIRGIGSLTAGNEPLYVIDGVPLADVSGDTGIWSAVSMTGLDNFNPDDIESIQVLKDAASAAIYGSRATNGVILITTKSGRKNQDAKVTIDTNVSFSRMTRKDKLEKASSDQFIEMLNEAVDNYNLQTGSTIERYWNPAPGVPATDWVDLVTRTAVSTSTTASIVGGNNKTDYYLSASYKRNEGYIIRSSMSIYNLKTSINTDVKSWLKAGTTINLNYTRNNRVPVGNSIGVSVIQRAADNRVWEIPVRPNGEWAKGNTDLVANHNPLQAIMEEDPYINSYRMTGNLYLQFLPMKGLSIKTTLSEDFHHINERVYYTDQHPYGNSVGKNFDARRTTTSTLWETFANYDTKFDFGLNLSAMAGYSIQKYVSTTANQTGQGFPSPSFDVNSVAAEFLDISTAKSTYLMQSYFGRVSLNYLNRYLLTGTIRSDGSSKFAPEHRYGYFPSVSVGWNINEESWWRYPQTALKIRASYGKTGNQGGIGHYAYQALANGGFNYNGVNGLGLSTAGNRDLKWEKADQYDVGVDLSFFNNALTFNADVFVKDTKDLLYSRPMAASSGYTTLTTNIGSMRNKGLELAIGGNARAGEFSWHGDFNISFIRNKLTSLINDEDVLISGNHALKVGKPVGSFYIIKWEGIYQHDEDVPESLYNSSYGVRAGDCIYDDYNGDGNISTADKQFCGDANPNFTGGLNNTFQWRGLDLNIFLTFSQGNKVLELFTGGRRLGNGTWPALKKDVEGRWTGPGTTNEIPRAIYGLTYNSTAFVTSRQLHDASYIRCRSLSLGYTFPKKLIRKLHLDNLRVYAQADNLFLITKFPYYDPEVSINTSAVTYGTDFLYPGQPRTFIFGLNVKF